MTVTVQMALVSLEGQSFWVEGRGSYQHAHPLAPPYTRDEPEILFPVLRVFLYPKILQRGTGSGFL